METENEKMFKTKTGFCHVFPDKIVLTRDGIAGNVSKVIVGQHISQILIVYSLVSLFLFYLSIDSWQRGQTASVIFFAVMGCFLLYTVLNSINNSAASIIDRHQIEKVKFKKAVFGLTRAHFIIYFRNEKGSRKKRLIMLPGSLIGGQEDIDVAVKIMQEEGFIK